MEEKEYIGNMPLEDFKKLSYDEQGKYLASLKGETLENEESVDINDLCQQIPCTKEEYVQEHGYIPLTELQTRINNMVDYTIGEAEVALDDMIKETLSEFNSACDKIDAEHE